MGCAGCVWLLGSDGVALDAGVAGCGVKLDAGAAERGAAVVGVAGRPARGGAGGVAAGSDLCGGRWWTARRARRTAGRLRREERRDVAVVGRGSIAAVRAATIVAAVWAAAWVVRAW